MCLELIRSKEHLSQKQPNRTAYDINFFYTAIEDFGESTQLTPLQKHWLDYPFFESQHLFTG